MSFESEKSVFVHFPKTGGTSVHWTADAHGRKLKCPPADNGHVPASWFASTKPSWSVLREPVGWYVSMYRFCVDTGWVHWPELAGSDFGEFVGAKAGEFSRYCESLELDRVTHLYPYSRLQEAYNSHVGPESLERRCVSVSPHPDVSDSVRRMISDADRYGYRMWRLVIDRPVC